MLPARSSSLGLEFQAPKQSACLLCKFIKASCVCGVSGRGVAVPVLHVAAAWQARGPAIWDANKLARYLGTGKRPSQRREIHWRRRFAPPGSDCGPPPTLPAAAAGLSGGGAAARARGTQGLDGGCLAGLASGSRGRAGSGLGAGGSELRAPQDRRRAPRRACERCVCVSFRREAPGPGRPLHRVSARSDSSRLVFAPRSPRPRPSSAGRQSRCSQRGPPSVLESTVRSSFSGESAETESSTEDVSSPQSRRRRHRPGPYAQPRAARRPGEIGLIRACAPRPQVAAAGAPCAGRRPRRAHDCRTGLFELCFTNLSLSSRRTIYGPDDGLRRWTYKSGPAAGSS